MAVLMRAAGIQTVVQMDGFQPVDADDLVELAHYAVEVSRYVIARVPNMARVQTHAHVVGQLHAVDDARDFLERAPDFASLSCHRLKQKRGRLVGVQHLVERVCDHFNAGVGALPCVASRVHVVKLTRCFLHSHEVIRQRRARKLARFGVLRTRVERIGRVRQDARDAVRRGELVERCHVGGVDCLRLAPARVAREELERVRVNRDGVFCHRQKALRDR